jgi:threonine synthase
VRYISTRGNAPAVGLTDVLLGGPAPDGGLYLPETWPQISRLPRRPYAHVAFSALRPFVGDAFTDAELRQDVEAAYATFDTPEIAPLVETGPEHFLLELFHGPTLAFKDIALQLLGRLFTRALAKRHARATVIVATSGDTGSAAIAAFRSRPNIDIVVLHPKGRVSEVQRRQMTAVLDDNVHNVALEGSFDDTQAIVKALFADAEFAARTHLTAVNSINFARIAAQCVYYFTAAAAVDGAPAFVVPTGNFGDVFAGEAAMRMGLSVRRLVVATNTNDILARALATGVYESHGVTPTLSPSMDIQVASNFERALFEASGRDAGWVCSAMNEFARTRRLQIRPDVLTALRARYAAGHASDVETVAAIARVHAETGKTVDPHTAVGFAVAQSLGQALGQGPIVLLATAHPAKFPEAIAKAGLPAPAPPPQLANLMQGKERYTMLPNDRAAVRRFILERTKNS